MDRSCIALLVGLCDGDLVLDVEGRSGSRRRCFCTEIEALADPYNDPARSELLSLLCRTITHSGSLTTRARWASTAEDERLRRADF